MSDSIAQEVRREAAREERYSRWRGAALAAIVTFMSPRDRAAFQYSQSADYGSLKRDTQLELARSGGPRDEEVAALSKRLADFDLHRRVAADLQGRPASESSSLG